MADIAKVIMPIPVGPLQQILRPFPLQPGPGVSSFSFAQVAQPTFSSGSTNLFGASVLTLGCYEELCKADLVSPGMGLKLLVVRLLQHRENKSVAAQVDLQPWMKQREIIGKVTIEFMTPTSLENGGLGDHLSYVKPSLREFLPESFFHCDRAFTAHSICTMRSQTCDFLSWRSVDIKQDFIKSQQIMGRLDAVLFTVQLEAVPISSSNFSCLLEDMKQLFEKGLHCDVTINVVGTLLHAHKSVLSCRSPVFEAMFRNDTKEARESLVIIDDADADTVKEMLEYMYTGRAPNINTVAHKLLPLADKYQLQGLLATCVSVLTGNINIESVVSLLILSDTYHIDELKQIALHFMCRNSIQVCNSSDWNSLLQYPHLLSDAFKTMADLGITYKTEK